MQDLTLQIEGEWWDSILYKGRLHLLHLDGSIKVFDWEELIADLAVKLAPQSGKAFKFAFSESNALYRQTIGEHELRSSFNSFEEKTFTLDKKLLSKYLVFENGIRFPFPSATSAMYYDTLITASPEGVHSGHFDPDEDLFAPVEKLTDLPSNQAWPAYGVAAIAGGTEGLFELDLGVFENSTQPKPITNISRRQADFCDWMFQNIVASSLESGSYLAEFSTEVKIVRDGQATKKHDATGDLPPVFRKSLGEARDLSDDLKIRGNNSPQFSWGSQDKFYVISDGELGSFRFLRDGRVIPTGNTVSLNMPIDNLVSVQTALFGLILEFDQGIIVIKSDETTLEIAGEPARVKTFPRSKRYENHLHIMRDDALEIRSVNSDFEINQFEKRFGSKFYDRQ